MNPSENKWTAHGQNNPAGKWPAIYLSLILPIIYFFIVYAYSLNIPFADDFSDLDKAVRIIQSGQLSDKLEIIFSQHNEHRIAFNRLIYILSHFFDGEIDFRILILIGNTALLGLLFLFYKNLTVRQVHIWAVLPITLLLFQLQHWKNMIWATSALSNQFVLCFAGLAFYFLKKNTTTGLLWALIFAASAVFTQGSGVAVLLIGFTSLILEKRFRQGFMWASGAFPLLIFYFRDFHGTTSFAENILSPAGLKNAGLYFFSFLGSTLSFNNTYAAFIMGIMIILYWLFLTGKKYYLLNSWVYLFITYILLSAGAAAIGRSSLGLENVFAPRYKIVSITLLILIYISLAELFVRATGSARHFIAGMILLAVTSYGFSFKSGKSELDSNKIAMTWFLNQWVNVNNGLFFPPGERFANSILLAGIQGGFYHLPHQLLEIPAGGYAASITDSALCARESEEKIPVGFGVIPVGPENAPFMIRIEGVIYDTVFPSSEYDLPLNIVLRSQKGDYIFAAHRSARAEESAFFKKDRSNTGFVALIPFEELGNGAYQIGFCINEETSLSNYFISAHGGRFAAKETGR